MSADPTGTFTMVQLSVAAGIVGLLTAADAFHGVGLQNIMQGLSRRTTPGASYEEASSDFSFRRSAVIGAAFAKARAAAVMMASDPQITNTTLGAFNHSVRLRTGAYLGRADAKTIHESWQAVAELFHSGRMTYRSDDSSCKAAVQYSKGNFTLIAHSNNRPIVHLCDAFFFPNRLFDNVQASTLLHEAFHVQFGWEQDVYRGNARRRLPARTAVTNAESYVHQAELAGDREISAAP